MRITTRTNVLALATTALSMTFAGTIAQAQTKPAADNFKLEEIIVTAQKVERSLQDSPLAVTAVSGENLAKENILSYADLARSTAGLSFSEGSPLDQELNIRGVVSVRIDSPTADPSIGIFTDGLYMGRTGQLNTDFFDIERVEVIRGPQGVLMGKNVVGGALSIISNSPKFDPEGMVRVSYGNYKDIMSEGYVTGGIAPGLAARFSYKIEDRAGFAYDIGHDRDLENKKSAQFRAQLLYQPDGSDLYARLVFDYSKDSSNGINRVGMTTDRPGTHSFSLARDLVRQQRGHLSDREGIPYHPLFTGDTDPTAQFLDRESWALNLTIRKNLTDDIVVESITGYRYGTSGSMYSQTGIDPQNHYLQADTTVNIIFDSVVQEKEKFKQFSEELNFSSDNEANRFSWIVGAYFQHAPIQKNDVFQGNVKPSAAVPTVPTLTGESEWFNHGTTDTYAAFGQLGFKITDTLKITAGGRYTKDKKDGTISGLAVATGDFFDPTDTVALTPLSPAIPLGGGYTANYKDSWSEFTPQVILEFKPNDDLMFYANYAKGFKGGGFEDTAPSAVAAKLAFNPETVDSYEIGAKIDFWDNRARLNVAGYYMDYKDLQVTQTNAICLCNITDNAGDAEIKGIEGELRVLVAQGLQIFGSATYLDGKYKNFTDSLGVNNNGNQLQRTPKYQFNAGFDYNTDLMGWQDGLNLHVNYAYKGKFHWDPDNITSEPGHGLLDARLTISPTENISIAAYGKNILGEDYRVFVINFFGDEVASLGAPGTYGVELAVKF